MRENQEVHVEMICQKGIGKQHTKWSPVSTAYYRLHPKIELKKHFKAQEAVKLKNLCPKSVFDIEDSHLVVKNIRDCTSCRECIREDDSRLILSKISDHFICKECFLIKSQYWISGHLSGTWNYDRSLQNTARKVPSLLNQQMICIFSFESLKSI